MRIRSESAGWSSSVACLDRRASRGPTRAPHARVRGRLTAGSSVWRSISRSVVWIRSRAPSAGVAFRVACDRSRSARTAKRSRVAASGAWVFAVSTSVVACWSDCRVICYYPAHFAAGTQIQSGPRGGAALLGQIGAAGRWITTPVGHEREPPRRRGRHRGRACSSDALSSARGRSRLRAETAPLTRALGTGIQNAWSSHAIETENYTEHCGAGTATERRDDEILGPLGDDSRHQPALESDDECGCDTDERGRRLKDHCANHRERNHG